HIAGGHGPLRMRDDDELRPLLEFLNHPHVTFDVPLVESRIDLVEDTEGTGLALEDREQKRHRSERLLATAQERNAAELLSRRTGDNIDAALEHVLRVFEHDVPVPAAEQLAEQLLEVL